MGNPRPPPPPPPPEKPGLLSAIFGFSRPSPSRYPRRKDSNQNRRNTINRRIDVGRLNTRRCRNILFRIEFQFYSSELKTRYQVNLCQPEEY